MLLFVKVTDEKYLHEQFINKVIEIDKDRMLCTVWDTDLFYVINRKNKNI
jgi:hypothetical protein